MARCLTSKRLPTLRCEFASLVTPSNWRYASRSPASLAWRQNSRSCANLMPFVAALHAKVTHVARVLDGAEEVRRERRLAARELHAHLPARLDGQRVVEDLPDLVPLELVDVTDLVRVHEARVAHHVAAVGEVDREHAAAAVFDAARAVVAQVRQRREEVATGVELLDARGERGVDAHHVLEAAVLLALLDHPQLAVALDDGRADLAGLAVDERRQLADAVEDVGADLFDALRAQRIGLARPAELGLGLVATLEQRRWGPRRLRRSALEFLVEALDQRPGGLCGARSGDGRLAREKLVEGSPHELSVLAGLRSDARVVWIPA